MHSKGRIWRTPQASWPKRAQGKQVTALLRDLTPGSTDGVAAVCTPQHHAAQGQSPWCETRELWGRHETSSQQLAKSRPCYSCFTLCCRERLVLAAASSLLRFLLPSQALGQEPAGFQLGALHSSSLLLAHPSSAQTVCAWRAASPRARARAC